MTFTGRILGFVFKVRNLGKTQARLLLTLWLLFLVGVFAGLAWGFMHLWAWYVPVFWASAPILGYWHSLVTMVLLLALFRRGGSGSK